MTDDCLFCRIVAGEIPATVVHETDDTLAFRDIDPKAHHQDVAALAVADPALAGRVLATCAAVAEKEGLPGDGYRVIFNVGAFGGQEVFHVHAHVVGGRPLGPMISA